MDDHIVEHAALIPQTRPNSLRAAKKNCWAGHPQALGSWAECQRHVTTIWLAARAIGTA
jgi:hypothetical protein